jgi:hypothetical protein
MLRPALLACIRPDAWRNPAAECIRDGPFISKVLISAEAFEPGEDEERVTPGDFEAAVVALPRLAKLRILSVTQDGGIELGAPFWSAFIDAMHQADWMQLEELNLDLDFRGLAEGQQEEAGGTGGAGAPTFSRLISGLPACVTNLAFARQGLVRDEQLACLFGALRGGLMPRLADLEVYGAFGYRATAALVALLESGALSETLTSLELSRVRDTGNVVRSLGGCAKLTAVSMRRFDASDIEPFLTLMDHIISGRIPNYHDPPFHHLGTAWSPEGMDHAVSLVSHAISLGRFQDLERLMLSSTGYRFSDARALRLWQTFPMMPKLKVSYLCLLESFSSAQAAVHPPPPPSSSNST